MTVNYSLRSYRRGFYLIRMIFRETCCIQRAYSTLALTVQTKEAGCRSESVPNRSDSKLRGLAYNRGECKTKLVSHRRLIEINSGGLDSLV